MSKKLSNLNIVAFESRRAQALCDLIKIQGGRPISAPAMKEVPLENNPDAFRFAEALFRNEISVLILLTGVGTRALVSVLSTRYPKEDVVAAFKKVTIIPRGPKPIKALDELGVPYAVAVPEPNTWHEILETLDQHQQKIPLKGRLVAVQEYGVTNHSLIGGLEERGAKLLRVPVYRWALPDDLEPLKKAIRAIVDRKVEVAIFTTAVQADHLFKVADEMKLGKELKKAFQAVVIASIGPDCSEAIRSFGLPVDIQPEISKMGPFIQEVAQRAKEILERKSHP